MLNKKETKSQSDKAGIIGQTIEKFFDKANLDLLARESKFVKRESKLNGSVFLQALVLNNLDYSSLTLQEICYELSATYGISISKQGIDQRFNKEAVEFLKQALEQRIAFQTDTRIYQDLFKSFKGVRIKDSTKFVAPDTLECDFATNGMGGHKAGLKIGYEFDLKTGKILHLELFPANSQDLTDAQTTVGDIKPDELVIRDLGFIVVDVLQKIEKQEGFYLNRLHSNVFVYEQNLDGEIIQLDYLEICRSMRTNQIQRIEKEVFIGSKQHYKVRMIIEQLPQEQINERLRKLKETAKRKGYTPTELAKAKASINVYITNTNPELIPASKVRLYYSLRWQIELMFKTWKSILAIHQLKTMQQQRYLCHLYAKLIWVAISFTIFRFANEDSIERGEGLISLSKTIKHLKTRLKEMIISKSESRKEQIDQFLVFSSKYWKLENKKGKTGLEELLKTIAK